MARKPVFDDEKSRLAVWSARLGIFALAVAAISAIIVRSGFLEVKPALATFVASLACAGLAVVFGFASAVPIWRSGFSGIGRAVLGVVLGLLLLAYPAFLAYRASKLPDLNDVATDTSDPPRFGVLARLRPRGMIDYPGATAAAKQTEFYPNIEPLDVAATPKAAFDVALAVIDKRKWRVVDSLAPSPARREGVIEAVARTPVMGFRDDVVVRVRPMGSGARIDVRSASRIAMHDVGTNASRVVNLLNDIDDAVGNAKPERPEPERKPQPANQRPQNSRPAPKR